MVEYKRSIGIILNNIIDDKSLINKILIKLKECQDVCGVKLFYVVFYYKDIDSKTIKDFVKEYSDIFFGLNVDITRNFKKKSFFLIDQNDLVKNCKFRYDGNILEGFKEYKKLIAYIIKQNQKLNLIGKLKFNQKAMIFFATEKKI